MQTCNSQRRKKLGERRDGVATLLDGEALGLTRTAVEAALAGDMLAIELCLERGAVAAP
jgi:hypothetical protein